MMKEAIYYVHISSAVQVYTAYYIVAKQVWNNVKNIPWKIKHNIRLENTSTKGLELTQPAKKATTGRDRSMHATEGCPLLIEADIGYNWLHLMETWILP